MSSSLFAAHNPVIHCAPKRPKRRRGRVLILLALAALAVWLLSGCHTTQETSPEVHGVIIGLGAFAFVMFVYFSGRKARRETIVQSTSPSRADEWRVLNWLAQRPVGEWQRFPAIADGALVERARLMVVLKRMRWNRILEVTTDGPLKKYRLIEGAWPRGEELEADLQWSAVGTEADKRATPIQPEDLREIVGSLVVTVCEAREMVRKATLDCGSEDYGDRLKGAERRLKQAIACLGGLLEHCDTNAGGGRA